jgi:hypothetical protein
VIYSWYLLFRHVPPQYDAHEERLVAKTWQKRKEKVMIDRSERKRGCIYLSFRHVPSQHEAHEKRCDERLHV